MKKILILASMLIVFGFGKSMAEQANLFHYDAVTIENQMAQLDQLEGYVMENPGITLGEMATSGNTLASLVSNTNGISGLNLTNEKVFGIPSFLWGCVFSWVGVLVVYLVGQDKAETKSAIVGCIVEGVIIAAWQIVWVVILGNGGWYY